MSLDLSWNKLTCLPQALAAATRLTRLSLRGNTQLQLSLSDVASLLRLPCLVRLDAVHAQHDWRQQLAQQAQLARRQAQLAQQALQQVAQQVAQRGQLDDRHAAARSALDILQRAGVSGAPLIVCLLLMLACFGLLGSQSPASAGQWWRRLEAAVSLHLSSAEHVCLAPEHHQQASAPALPLPVAALPGQVRLEKLRRWRGGVLPAAASHLRCGGGCSGSAGTCEAVRTARVATLP